MGGCCSKSTPDEQPDFGADDDDVHQPAKQPRISEWNLTALAVQGHADGERVPSTAYTASAQAADHAAATLSPNGGGGGGSPGAVPAQDTVGGGGSGSGAYKRVYTSI